MGRVRFRGRDWVKSYMSYLAKSRQPAKDFRVTSKQRWAVTTVIILLFAVTSVTNY